MYIYIYIFITRPTAAAAAAVPRPRRRRYLAPDEDIVKKKNVYAKPGGGGGGDGSYQGARARVHRVYGSLPPPVVFLVAVSASAVDYFYNNGRVNNIVNDCRFILQVYRAK